MIKSKFMYILNRKIKKQSEQVFEGISRGRKKALENWFRDKWVQMENVSHIIKNFDEDTTKVLGEMNERLKQYKDFCEFIILDDKGIIFQSTYNKHKGIDMSSFPNYKKGMQEERFMYGPYVDKYTLDIDLSKRNFQTKLR